MFTKKAAAVVPPVGAGAKKANPWSSQNKGAKKKGKPVAGAKPAWKGIADKMLGKAC